ncbi:MAG: autotransporter domain-containing protein [Alphaproteobacteria bacterium]
MFIGNKVNTYNAGAILNSGKIGSIEGIFVGNETNHNGIIMNEGTIETISADFIKNIASRGAAIYNNVSSEIGTITGAFSENHALGYGGAIYNDGNIGTIASNFVENSSINSGGAIYNNATISEVLGVFSGNTSDYQGGAIYNNNKIGTISGEFKDNIATKYSAGAIYNNSVITTIYANFINNKAVTYGAGIYNAGIIETITGQFIGNETEKNGGGAILNNNHIDSISGKFSLNKSGSYGGAIYNAENSKILSIFGEFEENISNFSGGAIYNIKAEIGTIEGIFKNNKSVSGWGGAIYNDGIINSILGDFTGNRSETYSGGAIYNNTNSTIDSIQGNFKNNYALSYGGAIYNNSNSTIKSIEGTFEGNISNNQGGAIYNNGLIENIVGIFRENLATKYSGGAIHNNGKIGEVFADFKNNVAENNSGGAIYNAENSKILSIVGDFEENTSGFSGGAIYNDGTINSILGDFIGNRSEQYSGGAVYNNTGGAINSIQGNFKDNYALSYGGAIYNNSSSTIKFIEGTFEGNSSNNQGGAIYNNGLIENIVGDFINNSVSLNQGGAIYNRGTITLSTSENKKSILFENNHDVNGLNAIFMANSSVLNLKTISNSYINIKDTISSDKSANVINKTGTGSLYLWGDNSAYSGEMNVKEGNLYAMFEEGDTEWNGARSEFVYNATLKFSNGTTFRPMMNGSKTKLAELNLNNTTIPLGGGVALVPYAVSSLNVGTYSFSNNYYGFEGWETDLAKVDTSKKDSVGLVIKRDLVGYQGLSSIADIYRKRTDLSLAEREIFDNIYYTGEVSESIKKQFKVIEGQDKISYATVHKAGVRQFSRQISSRLQNKNCPSCGMANGYSDEHLWFNIGQNFVKKDTKGSSLGYEYDPISMAIGYDHDLIPNVLNIGVALSYAYGDIKGKGGELQNNSDTNEYMTSLYWKYKPYRAYVTGSLGGGLIKSKTKILGSTMDVRGEYDTRAAFTNFEFGYDLGNNCGIIEPFVGLEYAYIYSQAYSEKGVGARHFDSNYFNSIELPIGLRVSRNIISGPYLFTPAVEVAYSRSLGDVNSKIGAHFVSNPESPWVLKGVDESRNSLRSSLNLKINNLNTPIAFNLGYGRDTRSNYSDDQFYLTIRYNF